MAWSRHFFKHRRAETWRCSVRFSKNRSPQNADVKEGLGWRRRGFICLRVRKRPPHMYSLGLGFEKSTSEWWMPRKEIQFLFWDHGSKNVVEQSSVIYLVMSDFRTHFRNSRTRRKKTSNHCSHYLGGLPGFMMVLPFAFFRTQIAYAKSDIRGGKINFVQRGARRTRHPDSANVFLK